MKTPRISCALFTLGVFVGLPLAMMADPIFSGTFEKTFQQTSPTSASVIQYSSGLSLNGNLPDGGDPDTFLPSAIVYSNAGPLLPGNQISMGVSASVATASGPGFSSYAIGEAHGPTAIGWGYYSSDLFLFSPELADVSSTITGEVVGGLDDGFLGTATLDANRFGDGTLFTADSFNALANSSANQSITLNLTSGFLTGSVNGFWLTDLITGNVASGSLGEFDTSFVISEDLLQAGRGYSVGVYSQRYLGDLYSGDSYISLTEIEFTVGVPDSGTTSVSLGLGLALLLAAHRRKRR